MKLRKKQKQGEKMQDEEYHEEYKVKLKVKHNFNNLPWFLTARVATHSMVCSLNIQMHGNYEHVNINLDDYLV